MKTLCAVILAFAGILVPLAHAEDYYVSSTRAGRSDSNAGTDPNAPWATLSRVVNILGGLQPGDTIHLERGSVFEVDTSSGSDSGNYLKLQKGGTAGAPITLTGSDYGTGNRPVIRRTGGSGMDTFILIRDVYITIRDIEFDGNMQAGFATTGIAFWADGTYDGENGVIHHVQILNNYIHNLGGTSDGATRYVSGIIINTMEGYSVRDCLIEGNTVSDYSANGLNQYSGDHYRNVWRNNVVINTYPIRDYSVNSALQTGTGTDNIFENNYLNDTTLTSAGAAIRTAGKISSGGVNTLRNNVIVDSGNHGIWFVMSNQAGSWLMQYEVYGNVILGSSKAGIMVDPGGDWGPGSYVNIYNNTLYNNWRSGGSLSDGEVTIKRYCDNTTVGLKNNLIYHDGNAVCLSLLPYHNATVLHNNNLYYRPGSTSQTAVNNEGTQYTLANVTSYESTAQNSDPLFIDPAQLPTSVNYTTGTSPDGLAVQEGSPAIGNGVDLGSPYERDVDNTIRTGAWSIGAYQVSGSAPPPVEDTTAPSVAITAPSAGSTVSGTAVAVAASASDDIGVIGVQFKLDGVNLGSEDTLAPYSVVWNTTSATNGSYTLRAVARDAAGNMTTSAGVMVTVDNEPVAAPTVVITAPSDGATVSDTYVTISAAASSDVGIAGVQFRLGTWNLGSEDTTEPYSVSWYTLSASAEESITAIARDINGNMATSAVVTVTVEQAAPSDTIAPSVSMTAPSAGATVSGNAVSVAASASDDTGVVGVQFKLDGADLGAEDSTAPYSIVWDSTMVTNATYTLSAVARDAAGNSALADGVTITVDNVEIPEGAIVSETNIWNNQSFAAQTGQFEVEFDAVPSADIIGCVTGISKGPASEYDDLAVIIRFNSSGGIDARNGDDYVADTTVSYAAGASYHFRIPIDVETRTYSVYVQLDGGAEILLANQYAFRTSQSAVTSLDTVALMAVVESHMVLNFSANTVAPAKPAAPTGVRIRED